MCLKNNTGASATHVEVVTEFCVTPVFVNIILRYSSLAGSIAKTRMKSNTRMNSKILPLYVNIVKFSENDLMTLIVSIIDRNLLVMIS